MPTDSNAPAALRRRVNDELTAFLERERNALPPEGRPLLDELEAVVTAGGKRLRPLFCYWGYRAAGGTDGRGIISVAAALELLHTFALVHDDLMDRSLLRRGRPSSFRALTELGRGVPHRGDAERFGLSAAVLVGDLALVLADRLLATADVPPAAAARAAARFDRMRVRAISGQYLDLLAAHRGDADEGTALRIGALKSAGYTVSDPLTIGGIVAGGDRATVQALEAFGEPLGEAFQIRDDILGAFGDPDRTGKDRDSDLREGKHTILLAKARARAGGDDRLLLTERVGMPDLTTAEAERVRRIIEATGALDAAIEMQEALTERARAALEGSAVPADAKRALRELAGQVSTRET